MIISIKDIANRKNLEKKRLTYRENKTSFYIPLTHPYKYYTIVKCQDDDYKYAIEFSTEYSDNRFRKFEVDNYNRAIIRPNPELRKYLNKEVSGNGRQFVYVTLVNNENYGIVTLGTE